MVVSSEQFVQQGFCLLQVDGIKAFGAPALDGCRSRAGCSVLVLLLPAQTHGRPQVWGVRLLVAGDMAGLMNTDFCLRLMSLGENQPQLPLEPTHGGQA
jgi:hypothetical protein